jgi:ubiquinone/menaquinone biosynthesis C-methylase UbiE
MPETRAPANEFEPPGDGLYKRFFAWLVSRLQEHYGDDIDDRKRRMLAATHGRVVEIGAGAGANMRFYPPGVELLLIEPNRHMHSYLRRESERLGRPVEVRAGTAERMDVDAGSADFVVCTLVLCSVGSQEASLREALRVLKPGGRFLFLEHVAAPDGTQLRRWQRRLRWLWRRIGDGCTLDRETWVAIEAAGFAALDIEHFDSRAIPLARPHIAGTATKPGAAHEAAAAC